MRSNDSMPALRKVPFLFRQLTPHALFDITLAPPKQRLADSRTLLNKILLETQRKQQEAESLASSRQVDLVRALAEIEQLQLRQRLGYILKHGMLEQQVDRTSATLQIAQKDLQLSRELFQIGKKYIYLVKKLKGIDFTVAQTSTGFNLATAPRVAEIRKEVSVANNTASANQVQALKSALRDKQGRLQDYQSKMSTVQRQVSQLLAAYLQVAQQNERLRRQVQHFQLVPSSRIRAPTFQIGL